jgi:hypothetical protein
VTSRNIARFTLPSGAAGVSNAGHAPWNVSNIIKPPYLNIIKGIAVAG